MEAGKGIIRKRPSKGQASPIEKSQQSAKQRKPVGGTRKKEAPPTDLSWQEKGLLAGSQVAEIPIADIDYTDNTFQCRVTVKNLKPLMNSIQKEGQLEPVRLKGRKPPYQIVCGFSRIEAIQRLKGDKVKAIIDHAISDDDAFRLSYSENAKRQTLTPMDKAHVVGWLEKAGKTQATIALEMGLSEKQVGNLKRALDFPDEVKKAITGGALSLKHGLLLHSAAKVRKVDFDQWIKRIKSDSLSVEGLKKVLNKDAPKRGRKKEFLKIKGHKIISPRFVLDLDKASEGEKEALKKSLQDTLKLI